MDYQHSTNAGDVLPIVRSGMQYRIIHRDDVNKPIQNILPIACGDVNDLDTPEKFGQWLEDNGCHFPAVIVDSTGAIVLSDPRYSQPITQQIDTLIESIRESNGLDFCTKDQCLTLVHLLLPIVNK